MECPNCEGKNIVKFFQEKLECPCCDEEIEIDYFMCPDCGTTFKLLGDNIYSCVQFSKDEFQNIFGGTKEEVLEHFNTDMMTDNIHSCIKCGGLAFEIEEGLYKCNICGFEVEVEDRCDDE